MSSETWIILICVALIPLIFLVGASWYAFGFSITFIAILVLLGIASGWLFFRHIHLHIHHTKHLKIEHEERKHAMEITKAALAAGHSVQMEYPSGHKIQTISPLTIPNAPVTIKEMNWGSGEQAALPSPRLPVAPPFRDMVHLITPHRIPVTYTAQGPVFGEVSDLLSMALIGKPKRGKTTALLYYLCILLKAGAEVWIWDPHGEMSELSYGLNYYDSLDEIAHISVAQIQAELDERDRLYKQTKLVKHPLVLLVDEVPVIADWEKTQKKLRPKEYIPSPYQVMKRFTLEARKWNGYVFISGQSLPAEVLPTLTRDNLSSRLVLECSADHARMIGLDKKTIDTLLPQLKGAERGTHIADFSSWSHPELADIPYTVIDDLRAIINGRGKSAAPFNVDTSDFQDLSGLSSHVSQMSPESRNQPITGKLVMPMKADVKVVESIPEFSKEDERQIIQIARTHLVTYGRVVRSKIPLAMTPPRNNSFYPVIKHICDREGW